MPSAVVPAGGPISMAIVMWPHSLDDSPPSWVAEPTRCAGFRQPRVRDVSAGPVDVAEAGKDPEDHDPIGHRDQG